KRALINIIENSLQAMPRGGTLSISAGLSMPRRGKKMMRIEVKDTGLGIDRDAMGRLFEPYFSTKDSGVGLGLAITKKAIDDHKGEIKIRSRKGKGTTVTILIPLAED
ncbi:MAG: ATP-binding protein, partial [Candidatus Aminicenantes bacterium]|nr:ATP-binding protein [Candidatus Aminicenantes bacterium]